MKMWSIYSVVADSSYALTVDVQSATGSVRIAAPDVPGTCRTGEDY